MIRLTGKYSGDPLYINPENIKVCRYEEKEKTVIDCGYGADHTVTETPEEVARKVLEWRINMEQYRAALARGEFDVAEMYEQDLMVLAGLEEPNYDAG